MSDNWMIRSTNYANCNCATNCGCQFNLPSTHGFCQFFESGHIIEGYYNDTSLTGLNWAFIIIWPGEIADGNGREIVVVDERANEEQRLALSSIVSGSAGDAGSNHFSVFASTCTELVDTLYLPIEHEFDQKARTANIKIPGLAESVGRPLINDFDGSEFHIALARTAGSFEFTYAELGQGTSSVQGQLAIELKDSYTQYCEIHYNQDGLIKAA